MISSAFILPHSPILIPAIGKNNTGLLKETIGSYEKINEELLNKQPEIIVIISPHGEINSDKIRLNISPEFNIGFGEFGDFSARLKVVGELKLAYELKEELEQEINFDLVTKENLDHGSSIPLFLLPKVVEKTAVLPLQTNLGSLEEHYRAGEIIGQKLSASRKKISVIASADLSHRLKHSAPGGYSPKAAKFDNKIIEHLNNPEEGTNNLLRIEDKLMQEVGECGLRPIALLLGILSQTKYEPQTLSYQNDLGVGYLALSFRLS